VVLGIYIYIYIYNVEMYAEGDVEGKREHTWDPEKHALVR